MREEDLLHAESFRDRASNVTEEGKFRWTYALKPSGKWYNGRRVLAYVYLSLFFILPLIKVNGLPLVLINLLEGKFILFSKIFWPQDFFIFAIGMITFIIFIVLFTVVFGRLFCGWVCPQTVFLEFIFRPLEWLIEGTPAQQKKLNNGPWTMEKVAKKTIKHAIYLSFSFLIAHTFLAYILGLDEVLKLMHDPIEDHISMLTGLLVFTLLFYTVFAFVRDMVCTTVCPYGRLQSVMFDKDTMQIAYDYKRGEPREKYKKNVARDAGDCINCSKCVQVCPTNIDIRNGIQMECVGCTACIDACNEVMLSIHKPKGLIRYASENEITTGKKFHFNTRMKAYTVLLGCMLVFMVYLIASRSTIDASIARVKGQLYQEGEQGKISNLFDMKIINKTIMEVPVQLKVENFPGTIRLVGDSNIVCKKEAISEFTFFLDIPKSSIHQRSSNLVIGIYQGNIKIQTIQTKFLGPFL